MTFTLREILRRSAPQNDKCVIPSEAVKPTRNPFVHRLLNRDSSGLHPLEWHLPERAITIGERFFGAPRLRMTSVSFRVRLSSRRGIPLFCIFRMRFFLPTVVRMTMLAIPKKASLDGKQKLPPLCGRSFYRKPTERDTAITFSRRLPFLP